MKKITLTLTLLLFITLSVFSQQYNAESDFKIEKTKDGNAILITKYKGKNNEVRIPPNIKNIPVTIIGRKVFLECSKLISVTIPDSVTSKRTQSTKYNPSNNKNTIKSPFCQLFSVKKAYFLSKNLIFNRDLKNNKKNPEIT
jgi:hypothetical protein